MWTCAGILALVACAAAITRDQFYSYGPGLDQELPRGQEGAEELRLQVPIKFYGESYDSIFVNNHGTVSFRADISAFMNIEFPLPYPSIAAFYTNVDTTESGTVYYRQTDEPHIIRKGEESIQSHFHEYYDFHPTQAFIASWIDVTYTSPHRTGKQNSFQLAIFSNGTESFVELLYPEKEIQWIQKESQPLAQPDAKAQAGLISEDTRYYTLRGSGSHLIRNINMWSNVHEPGKYLFRVGNLNPNENVALPDQYNEYETEIEEEKTCVQNGPSLCHQQARCVDYEAGICCQCKEGFYGNGKSCVKDDVPIRANGKLNGKINEVQLSDIDLQAYVVVADGRAYTALSQAPSTVSGSLQLLNVIGGAMSWLFAKPIGNAKNGYQLTGAVFNYTAEITLTSTNDKVIISQEYLGHDVFDQITLETDVRGTLPFINPTDKLEASEYEEVYSVVDLGEIVSESTRVITNKHTGEVYQATILQRFSYSPCKYAPQSEDMPTPLQLKVSNIFLGYDQEERVVRFGMSDKIMPLGEEDPCVQGRANCDPHSSCVPQGSSFTCVCKSGYTNIYNDGIMTCIDIDECAAGTHNCDPNAQCQNDDGGFRCRCYPGYNGDGVRCTTESLCANNRCDPNAQCVDQYGVEASCICNPGYVGDGLTCSPISSSDVDCNNCSPFADCITYAPDKFTCVCQAGFFGNGINCEEQVLTSTPESYTDPDSKTTYVSPQCNEYECVCPIGYSSYVDEAGSTQCVLEYYEEHDTPKNHTNPAIKCDSDVNCPPNSVCSYSRYSGDHECTCLEGYEGDGFECVESQNADCACGSNARCITSATGEQMCVCEPGYHGDGYLCRPNFSCVNNSDCEYNAECRPDEVTNEYVCQCVDGFTKDQNDACIPDANLCNGAVCAEHASCLYDATLTVNYCHCDPGYEGDGTYKCVSQVDNCNIINDCSMHAVCTKTEFTYECVCTEGYLGDGHNCEPEPNCKNNPQLCASQASCLKRNGLYQCECNTGYKGNGSFCSPDGKQKGNFLVASDGMFIYRVPYEITVHEYATPINTLFDQIAVAIDVDCLSGRVYWSDIVGGIIKRAAYDGTNFEQFLSIDIKSPEGIAIDWSARNIFWTDAKKKTIEVAQLDTRLRKVLFKFDGPVNLRGIAVHPQRGKIFWTDWNRAEPKIEWANMDGSGRGLFLGSPDVQLPNSLVIDWATERLCYADAGLKSIECVDIDSRRRETIASECPYPFGLAVHDNKFYWTDWQTSRIDYIDTRTQIKGHLPIATSSRKLFGVSVAPDHCSRHSNVCNYHNGNCEIDDICLPDGRGGRTCVKGE